MKKLNIFLQENKELVAEIFYKSFCFEYSNKEYLFEKDIEQYSLLREFFEDFFIIQKEESYLIFSLKDKNEIYKEVNVRKNIKNILEPYSNVLNIEAIYSKKQNKGLGRLNIKKLKKYADTLNLPVVVNTMIIPLIKIAKEEDILILKKSSLDLLEEGEPLWTLS